MSDIAPHVPVLDLFEEAIGLTPAQAMDRGVSLRVGDLASIMSAWSAATERGRNETAKGPSKSEIWPLVSHHTYGGRALFGTQRERSVGRALNLLVLHDGLVVADPLIGVHRALVTTSEDRALDALRRVTAELAEFEPLIAGGAMRLISPRPQLSDTRRAACLEVFGLTPDLRVFTDFVEAGVFTRFEELAEQTPRLNDAYWANYVKQVDDLYQRFGIRLTERTSRQSALRRVQQLAAAVIEVTWQFAVASEYSGCDLAFRGPIEQHFAEALIVEGFDGDMGPGRHFDRLEVGAVPNLDAARLTIADAFAVRREDSYEEFRYLIRSALDRLEADRKAGVKEYAARASFEEAMKDGVRRLRDRSHKASFREHVKSVSLPAALGVVGGLTTAPDIRPGVVSGAVSIGTIVWLWILGREAANTEVSTRYMSMLGGLS